MILKVTDYTDPFFGLNIVELFLAAVVIVIGVWVAQKVIGLFK